MNKCFICKKGELIKVANVRGEEIYCGGCRRIIVSSALNFKFAETEPEPCKTADGREGFKGPGKKAVCHGYTNDEEKEVARKKARESVYAFEHQNTASKIVNSTPFFTGIPSYASGDNPTDSEEGLDGESQEFTPQTTSVAPQSPIGAVTAPGGTQMMELNGRNPVNTASKRLANLIEDSLGKSFCTEHETYDECKPGENLH